MTVQAHTASVPAESTASCPFCGAAVASARPFCTNCGQPGASQLAGSKLHNAYTIIEVLHASATGAVYRAQDARRKREVAVKELLAPVGSSDAERAALQSAFVREVRRCAALRHPCLAPIQDSFSQDGRHYLVMALLPGQSLSSVLEVRGQGFPEGQVRAWTQHLLSLLDYLQAHNPPFVHGEIMPAHLMARTDGTPVLVNHSLSWRLGLRPRALLPGASAPEPAQPPGATRRLRLGRKETPEPVVDTPLPQDDLYGVSATIHAMLTGRDVFAGVAELALAFPLVRDLAPRVSVGTAEAVNRALSPDQDVRFTSTNTFRAALGLGATGAAHGARRAYHRPEDRRRSLAFAILAAVLVVIAGLVVYDQRNIGSALTAQPGEINPDLTMPAAARTLSLDDTFTQTGTAWYVDNQHAFLRGNELWLSDVGGTTPIKLTRSAYATGADGFIARATVRLAQGSAGATYGLVVLDRTGSTWDNVTLVVTADGRWALLRYYQHHAPALVAWHHSRYVRVGHNTPNELQLAYSPGRSGQPGTFSVTMNGHVVKANVPAGTAAPSGRVGLLAGPSAEVVADSLTVTPVGPSKVTVEDHFLNNQLAWSLAGVAPAALLRGGLLHVGPAVGVPWLVAFPHHLTFPPMPSTVTDEATFAVHASTLQGQQAGGVVFARPLSGRHAPMLAALINLQGNVSVVALSGHSVQRLVGPLADPAARMRNGLNTLRIRTAFTHSTLVAQVSVNDHLELTYRGPTRGVEAAAGMVAVGNASLDASALRLYGRGIHQ